MGADPISFGPFTLDRSSATLLSGGKPLAIGQRGYALLEALALADGPVPKAALMDAAWPGTIVEEGNLTVQIAALRKALGSRPDGQEWIVTVPRIGYRLLRGGAVPVASEATLPVVAVLPFANLGGDPEQDYFADGVVEDIITALSRFRSFATVSRRSSFVLKGRAIDVQTASRELGARYVLEGSVRKAGSRLRVTAQLVDGDSGIHLWAQNYDGAVEDIFDMQERITEGVAGVIVPTIQQAEIARARRERPQSPTAYDLYLRAVQEGERATIDSNRRAIELIDAALVLDPSYAPALAVGAHAREFRMSMGWPRYRDDDNERALQLAQAALELAGDDPAVVSRCGIVLLQVGQDYELALATMNRAVANNSNDPQTLSWAGFASVLAGRLDDAKEHYMHVLRLSPNDRHAYEALTGLAHLHICLGEYEASVAYAMRSMGANPNFNPTHWMLIAANALLGQAEEAKRRLELFLSIAPDATLRGLLQSPGASGSPQHRMMIEGLRRAGFPEG